METTCRKFLTYSDTESARFGTADALSRFMYIPPVCEVLALSRLDMLAGSWGLDEIDDNDW